MMSPSPVLFIIPPRKAELYVRYTFRIQLDASTLRHPPHADVRTPADPPPPPEPPPWWPASRRTDRHAGSESSRQASSSEVAGLGNSRRGARSYPGQGLDAAARPALAAAQVWPVVRKNGRRRVGPSPGAQRSRHRQIATETGRRSPPDTTASIRSPYGRLKGRGLRSRSRRRASSQALRCLDFSSLHAGNAGSRAPRSGAPFWRPPSTSVRWLVSSSRASAQIDSMIPATRASPPARAALY